MVVGIHDIFRFSHRAAGLELSVALAAHSRCGGTQSSESPAQELRATVASGGPPQLSAVEGGSGTQSLETLVLDTLVLETHWGWGGAQLPATAGGHHGQWGDRGAPSYC